MKQKQQMYNSHIHNTFIALEMCVVIQSEAGSVKKQLNIMLVPLWQQDMTHDPSASITFWCILYNIILLLNNGCFIFLSLVILAM